MTILVTKRVLVLFVNLFVCVLNAGLIWSQSVLEAGYLLRLAHRSLPTKLSINHEALVCWKDGHAAYAQSKLQLRHAIRKFVVRTTSLK